MAETPHITTAMAVGERVGMGAPRADFDQLLGKHEGVYAAISARSFAGRQAQANARLAAETAPEESRALRAS